MSWWANTDGPQVLNCRTLIPDVLKPISQDITNVEGGNSQEIGWFVGEETEDQPWIVYAILAVVIIGGSIMLSMRSSKSEEYGENDEYVTSIDSTTAGSPWDESE